MIKYGFYSEDYIDNSNNYYFFVEINFQGEPLGVAHVFINLKEGTTEVKLLLDNFKLDGFSEDELVTQIKRYCYEQMKNS